MEGRSPAWVRRARGDRERVTADDGRVAICDGVPDTSERDDVRVSGSPGARSRETRRLSGHTPPLERDVDCPSKVRGRPKNWPQSARFRMWTTC